MEKKDLLFLMYRFHNKISEITQTKSTNSHPFFVYEYFLKLNGPSCPHANAAGKNVNIKDFNPELKDLLDGFQRYSFEHGDEFKQS